MLDTKSHIGVAINFMVRACEANFSLRRLQGQITGLPSVYAEIWKRLLEFHEPNPQHPVLIPR
jgi:hypothetical protein